MHSRGFRTARASKWCRCRTADFNQAIVDLGEGRIDAVASGVAPLRPHAATGKIRLLAFINRQRAPFAPEVPTVAEAGYPDLTFDAVTGFFGWRDMPAELRERIAANVRGDRVRSGHPRSD